MTLSVDMTRFQAKIAALRVAVRPAVANVLPLAALDAILEAGYAEPIEDEQQPYQNTPSLVTDAVWDGNVALVGIRELFGWSLDPDRKQHCPTCLRRAADGPYRRSDLSDQPWSGEDLGLPPITAGEHDNRNPCHCVLVKRDPLSAQAARQALKQLAAAEIAAALEATWKSN